MCTRGARRRGGTSSEMSMKRSQWRRTRRRGRRRGGSVGSNSASLCFACLGCCNYVDGLIFGRSYVVSSISKSRALVHNEEIRSIQNPRRQSRDWERVSRHGPSFCAAGWLVALSTSQPSSLACLHAMKAPAPAIDVRSSRSSGRYSSLSPSPSHYTYHHHYYINATLSAHPREAPRPRRLEEPGLDMQRHHLEWPAL